MESPAYNFVNIVKIYLYFVYFESYIAKRYFVYFDFYIAKRYFVYFYFYIAK